MRKWYHFGVIYKTFISIIRNFDLFVLNFRAEKKIL